MKAMKKIGKILLWIAVVVVVLLLALPLWIGPVAKGVANAVAPKVTGTDFNLGEFALNPYTGTLHVGDMQLANPTNFSEKNAVDLKSFDVDFAMTSLVSGKKYRVELVLLDGISVYSDPTGSNFSQIAENATGGAKKDEAKAQEPPKTEKPAEPAKEEKKGKGVQIDRIILRNVTVKYGLVPVKIPMDIELNDIGKESEGGASFEEVWQTILNKVMSATNALGDLGKGAVDAAKGAVGAATDAAKGAADAAKNAVGGMADAIKSVDGESAKKVVDGAADTAKGAKDSAVDAAKKAGDSLKEAGENLKSLFK